MKGLFIGLFLVFAVLFSVAQTETPEKITVNTSDLTVDQLAKIKAQQEVETLQKKLDTYGKWVGVGGEVGNAIKEGLNAVVDVSDKFSKTDVGKFTMYLIAWKVAGKDFVRIFFGFLFLTVFTVFMFNYYKKNFTTYKIKTKDNGWRFWLPKEWTVVPETPVRERYEGYEAVKWLTIIMLAGGWGLGFAIMFA